MVSVTKKITKDEILQIVEEIVKKAGADKVTAIFTESEADHGKPDYDTRSIVDAALEFLNRY